MPRRPAGDNVPKIIGSQCFSVPIETRKVTTINPARATGSEKTE